VAGGTPFEGAVPRRHHGQPTVTRNKSSQRLITSRRKRPSPGHDRRARDHLCASAPSAFLAVRTARLSRRQLNVEVHASTPARSSGCHRPKRTLGSPVCSRLISKALILTLPSRNAVRNRPTSLGGAQGGPARGTDLRGYDIAASWRLVAGPGKPRCAPRTPISLPAHKTRTRTAGEHVGDDDRSISGRQPDTSRPGIRAGGDRDSFAGGPAEHPGVTPQNCPVIAASFTASRTLPSPFRPNPDQWTDTGRLPLSS